VVVVVNEPAVADVAHVEQPLDRGAGQDRGGRRGDVGRRDLSDAAIRLHPRDWPSRTDEDHQVCIRTLTGSDRRRFHASSASPGRAVLGMTRTRDGSRGLSPLRCCKPLRAVNASARRRPAAQNGDFGAPHEMLRTGAHRQHRGRTRLHKASAAGSPAIERETACLVEVRPVDRRWLQRLRRGGLSSVRV
jgi:hypothetical protein